MDTEVQIRRYIVENFLLGDEGGVTASQSLLETGVVDSTGVMELVAFLEQTFGIRVADEELVPENLDTIDSITGFVERKTAGSAAGTAAGE